MCNRPYPRLLEDMASYGDAKKASDVIDVEFTLASNVFECCFSLRGDMGSNFVAVYVLQTKQQILLQTSAFIAGGPREHLRLRVS